MPPIIPPLLLLVRASPLWLPLPLILLWPLLILLLLLGPMIMLFVRFRRLRLTQRVLLPVKLYLLVAAFRGLWVEVADGEGKRVCIRCW